MIRPASDNGAISKLHTAIQGFDLSANGGLPRGRSTLLSGTSGSAKTVFAAQFLAAGVARADEPGVFVMFEESPDDIRRNMAGFGWDICGWEAANKWAFVDATPEPGEPLSPLAGMIWEHFWRALTMPFKKCRQRASPSIHWAVFSPSSMMMPPSAESSSASHAPGASWA